MSWEGVSAANRRTITNCNVITGFHRSSAATPAFKLTVFEVSLLKTVSRKPWSELAFAAGVAGGMPHEGEAHLDALRHVERLERPAEQRRLVRRRRRRGLRKGPVVREQHRRCALHRAVARLPQLVRRGARGRRQYQPHLRRAQPAVVVAVGRREQPDGEAVAQRQGRAVAQHSLQPAAQPRPWPRPAAGQQQLHQPLLARGSRLAERGQHAALQRASTARPHRPQLRRAGARARLHKQPIERGGSGTLVRDVSRVSGVSVWYVS
eukprot:scaffold82666_cov61-Phaeocystis_antarctica.AAC.2